MDEGVTGLRRKTRIAALKTLYEIDCSAHKPDEVLARILQEKPLSESAVVFAGNLVTGVLQNKQSIDDTIRRFAPLFPVKQIAIIDRNILRLSIFEILFDNNVPVKAVVNEAVELAKSFGTDTSPKFINGVLGSIVADLSLAERNQRMGMGYKEART